VKDDAVAAISSGFHPVVAATEWLLAGEEREMTPYLDPAQAWVQNGCNR
jgi:hypothetical protein